MEHTKKLKEIRIVKHFDSMSSIFLKLASFLSFFFLLVTRFYCVLKSIGLGQIRSFEKMVPQHRYFEQHCIIALMSFYPAL